MHEYIHTFFMLFLILQSLISSIEKGAGKQIYEKRIKLQLNDYMGLVFEDSCIQYMYIPKIFENAPFFYGNIGRWWGNNPLEKHQEEIDIMAVYTDVVLIGECKWMSSEVGVRC